MISSLNPVNRVLTRNRSHAPLSVVRIGSYYCVHKYIILINGKFGWLFLPFLSVHSRIDYIKQHYALWLQTYQRMKTASTSAPPGNCSCNNHCKAKYINIYLGSVEFLLKQRQNQRQKNVSVTAPDAYMTSASTAYIALDSLSFFFL